MSDASNSEVITATDARGRTILLKAMDPADMLDLLEAAGPASTNEGFMRYAMAVCSVTDIDGVPVPRARNRDGISKIGRQLGNDGLTAAMGAMFGAAGEAAPKGLDVATAGN